MRYCLIKYPKWWVESSRTTCPPAKLLSEPCSRNLELSMADLLMIRADANVHIATGHVMRCLALAQAWKDKGGEAVFVMAESTPAVEKRLKAEGMDIERIDA